MLATKPYHLVFDFVKQNYIILCDIKHCDLYIYLSCTYINKNLKSIKYSLIQTCCYDIIYDASRASSIDSQTCYQTRSQTTIIPKNTLLSSFLITLFLRN